ncbi:MAG: DUF1801 domain-containing protein [Gemmatimonadetes bacterium]|nr:DUF1801 domain-containing protein [Gemmatimonadota bacterium]MYA76262.1 DUF1801 domain-containing protein [Gemmatimonadota bacterium]MYG15099.1 DUF1801 domain-containing protein [Gemmatimonadota bacterium]MYH19629.1 DUF1801 domain-containing protein [Gemmatimonadota bacterium]MYK98786.1 DUF1801 domain-containing protein [Gemmatimonadota bacterium]
MSELKTRPTDASVEAFIDAVDHPRRREDARTLLALMQRVTGEQPVMWGPAIVGYGSYHYRYASGQEADWPITGFSPRKQNLSIYIMTGFEESDELLTRLGKHKTGKSCLYVNKLADVDLDVLEKLVRASVAEMKRRYPD